ncbi:uncharacterized protein LOC121384442 [Gigantopelta aegis]|uniref:uncharacterized protein LOC121384442 n=1 Tax=Gigantopelta aegis TaxID=1735272 RepID=UPI001B8897A1|nr:uncharacterized protein LOC121384442 [Gigantopelta aegis]
MSFCFASLVVLVLVSHVPSCRCDTTSNWSCNIIHEVERLLVKLQTYQLQNERLLERNEYLQNLHEEYLEKGEERLVAHKEIVQAFEIQIAQEKTKLEETMEQANSLRLENLELKERISKLSKHSSLPGPDFSPSVVSLQHEDQSKVHGENPEHEDQSVVKGERPGQRKALEVNDKSPQHEHQPVDEIELVTEPSNYNTLPKEQDTTETDTTQSVRETQPENPKLPEQATPDPTGKSKKDVDGVGDDHKGGDAGAKHQEKMGKQSGSANKDVDVVGDGHKGGDVDARHQEKMGKQSGSANKDVDVVGDGHKGGDVGARHQEKMGKQSGSANKENTSIGQGHVTESKPAAHYYSSTDASVHVTDEEEQIPQHKSTTLHTGKPHSLNTILLKAAGGLKESSSKTNETQNNAPAIKHEHGPNQAVDVSSTARLPDTKVTPKAT